MYILFWILAVFFGIGLVTGLYEPAKVKADSRKKVLKGFGLLTAIFVVMALFAAPSDQAPSNSASVLATQLAVGQSGYVFIPSSPSDVIVAGTTKDTFDQFMKLVLAKDTVGVAKMVQDGDAYALDPNTQVKIIDAVYSSEGVYQVRILSGQYYSQSAWVSGEFISSNPSSHSATSTSAR